MTGVSSGQSLTVGSGEVSSSIVVDSGGLLFVVSGGIASATVVNSGGHVEAAGIIGGAVVSGGDVDI